MFKRVAKSKFALQTIAFLIGAYIRIVDWTARGNIIKKEHFDAALTEGKGAILVFWHGRMLLGATVRKVVDRRFFMLISLHRDGEMIARSVESFGVEFIRGSTANPKRPDADKGGAPATAQMIAALQNGDVVGITPDGPRGPAETIQPGLIKLAQFSGAPIVPAGFSSSRGRRLKTWDKFLFSLPFSRCVYVAGPPIWVSPENDPEALESARRKVENALQSVTRQADELAGRKDVNEIEY